MRSKGTFYSLFRIFQHCSPPRSAVPTGIFIYLCFPLPRVPIFTYALEYVVSLMASVRPAKFCLKSRIGKHKIGNMLIFGSFTCVRCFSRVPPLWGVNKGSDARTDFAEISLPFPRVRGGSSRLLTAPRHRFHLQREYMQWKLLRLYFHRWEIIGRH